MEHTPFHKIVSGEWSCFKIYEDMNHLAFLDKYPLAEGHTIIIPKKYYKWVWDIPDQELSEMIKVCKKIANHVQKVAGSNQVFSLILGTGVAYAHIHIIPSADRAFGMKIHKSLESMGKEELSKERATKLLDKYKLDGAM